LVTNYLCTKWVVFDGVFSYFGSGDHTKQRRQAATSHLCGRRCGDYGAQAATSGDYGLIVATKKKSTCAIVWDYPHLLKCMYK
jgi:hypothetical protein